MKSGYLQVSKKHQIYFETNGNPQGIPVLVIHGGPGVGLNQKDFNFFDPEKYFTILYDQRGAGKSLPAGELTENNTNFLVADINLLLDFLGIKKVILFGGSWGSCLSLVFAIHFPEKILGLVIRGLFLGTLANRKHFEYGGNAAQFPNVWNRLKSLVPVEHQDEIFNYYLDKILDGDATEQQIYAYELERYGMSHSSVTITPEKVTASLENFDGINKSRIFAYYSKHDFFLEQDYIIKNIVNIPASTVVHIVHGKQDSICPPKFAQELHSLLPQSILYLVEGGHSQNCTGVKETLLKVMAEW